MQFDYRVNLTDNKAYRCFEISTCNGMRARELAIDKCRRYGENQNLAILSVTYLGESKNEDEKIVEY